MRRANCQAQAAQLGCEALLQDQYEGGMVGRMHDMRVRPWRMAIFCAGDNRHDKGLGALRMELIRQTRADGVRELMAEQQDAAPAHADLQQSRCFVLDMHNVATDRGENPPAGSGEFGIG